MELTEIFEALTRPFRPDEHQERIIKGGGKWFFIKHQNLRDRLNEVCPGHWSDRYTLSHRESDGDPIYLCELTICGVTHTGIGDKSNEDSVYGTPAQRSFRKAFMDAAEQFGIAAYLDEQSADKREFTIRYLHSKGDGRGVKAARENGWTPGNLPTTQQKAVMREQEKAQRRAPANAITEPQTKRLWAIAKKSGFTDDGLHRLIAKWGFESTKLITGDKYNEICEYADDAGQATIFNQEPSIEEPKPFDRSPAYAEIEANMKTLGWKRATAVEFLKSTYGGKTTRDELNDGELLDFAEFLNRQVAALQQPQAS